jgi:hypothetical protein
VPALEERIEIHLVALKVRKAGRMPGMTVDIPEGPEQQAQSEVYKVLVVATSR